MLKSEIDDSSMPPHGESRSSWSFIEIEANTGLSELVESAYQAGARTRVPIRNKEETAWRSGVGPRYVSVLPAGEPISNPIFQKKEGLCLAPQLTAIVTEH